MAEHEPNPNGSSALLSDPASIGAKVRRTNPMPRYKTNLLERLLTTTLTPEDEIFRPCGAGSVGAQKYKTKPMWLKSNKANLITLLSNSAGQYRAEYFENRHERHLAATLTRRMKMCWPLRRWLSRGAKVQNKANMPQVEQKQI